MPQCHPQKSNIPVLCTYNLTQNVVHCFPGSCWKCWHKVESDWTMELCSSPSCLSLHYPQLQVFPVPLPFNDTNRLLRGELIIFVPNPIFCPANLCAYTCLPSHTVQTAAPGTASKGSWQSCQNLTWPSLRPGSLCRRGGVPEHTQPFSAHRYPWLKSVSPSAESGEPLATPANTQKKSYFYLRQLKRKKVVQRPGSPKPSKNYLHWILNVLDLPGIETARTGSDPYRN